MRKGSQKTGYFMYQLRDDGRYYVLDPMGKVWGDFTSLLEAQKFKKLLNEQRGKR